MADVDAASRGTIEGRLTDASLLQRIQAAGGVLTIEAATRPGG